jgi:ATP-dependent NAD(P)H-hydrate dehydratase
MERKVSAIVSRNRRIFALQLIRLDFTVLVCDAEGGLKRMGGQGDILSGVIATFLAWGKGYEDGVWK